MSSNPATSLPSDPADLFARLYDLLPEKAFGDRTVERWSRDAAVARLASELEEKIVDEGCLDDRTLAWLVLAGPEEHFATLQAIDAALDRLSPFSGGTTPDCDALAPLLAHYTETGMLSTSDVDGAVLFRCAFPGRPVGLAKKDEAFGLMRVSAETWERINFARIPSLLDLDVAPSARLENLLCIGCAPLLESYDEFDITATRRVVRPAYRIAPRAAPAIARIPTVLLEAEKLEAVIAVMPESTLNPDILTAWRQGLRTHAHDLDQLTWVLVGSGPDGKSEPPANRAVLLHRSGQVLIEQDKLYDFTLTPRKIREWKLPGLDLPGRLPNLVGRSEDIIPGSKLEVRESSLGRVAIMICEDLTRPQLAELARQAGVSHIFVPVFSTETAESWAQFKSGDRVQEAGSWVVVSTSLAVPRAIAPAKSNWNTSLAIGPKEDRDEWETDIQIGSTAKPDDVSDFWIRGGRVLRFTDFS